MVAVSIAAIATWPATVPATHPTYPEAPLGTAQAGMALLTSEPFCGVPYGESGERPSELQTHGGDMAFWKSRAVLACGGDDDDVRNDGFVVLDIADPVHPVKLGELRCVASASDIAIWGDLVFLAVDRNSEAGYITQPGPKDGSCTTVDYFEVDPEGVDPVRIDQRTPSTFAGVHIVSIADPGAPAVVASVGTNFGQGALRGAHNITVVPDLGYRAEDGTERPRVLVYAAFPGWSTQDVVQVPLDAPHEAGIAESITVPGLEPATGQSTDASGCHDISFFLPGGLATCHSLSGFLDGISGTIIWDVRDDPGDTRDDGASLLTPKIVSQVTSVKPLSPPTESILSPTSVIEGFPGRRDHSSAFSWDGRTLVISDENLHGLATNSCDREQSVLWFYDITDPYEPRLRSKQAAHPVAGNGWCPSKQISVVPMLNGDDVLIASWLGGGTTVVDFTDPGAPRQIGVFADFLGIDPFSGTDDLSETAADDDKSLAWASYWYDGHVFVNNAWGCARPRICFGSKFRGLDVLTLHGITAKQTARLQRFNFGTQECLPPLYNRAACK